ncbi:MAG: ester cyclase [Chloroflexi bacterium]|nr:ester cyclase [Chloroflexota bacterium]
MAHEENKALIRRLFEEVFNQGRDDVVDEIIAPNYVARFPGRPDPLRGPDGVKQNQRVFRTAFPDIHETVEEMITQGDRLAVRWTGSGTQHGPLMGIPPTGKQVTVTGISIFRIADGKVVEGWISMDLLAVLQQLGAMPPSAQPQQQGGGSAIVR